MIFHRGIFPGLSPVADTQRTHKGKHISIDMFPFPGVLPNGMLPCRGNQHEAIEA